MGIEKIANGIEQAKLGYMEAVCGAAERAKAEIKAANGDRSRSGSWVRERILGVVEAYEAERAKMAGEAMPKLKGLYSEGLEAAADVLAKQPTAGEAAYLQAFMMKQRITESDVEQAKIALRGSAVASAAMFDRADEKGVSCKGGVPGYIAVSDACARCYDEDSSFLPAFGKARIAGSGSDCAFSCDSIRASMRMKALANEFTNYLRAVAAFEQKAKAPSENRQGD